MVSNSGDFEIVAFKIPEGMERSWERFKGYLYFRNLASSKRCNGQKHIINIKLEVWPWERSSC